MTITSSPPVKLLVLGENGEQPFMDALQFFRQLSILWKFPVGELGYPPTSTLPISSSFTHVFVSYSSPCDAFEKWCCTIFDDQKIDKALLADGNAKVFGSLFAARFGVSEQSTVTQSSKQKLFHTGADPILMAMPAELSFRKIPTEPCTRLHLLDSSCLLHNTLGDCFMCKKGANYCLGIPIWQFGVPSFPAFFRTYAGEYFIFPESNSQKKCSRIADPYCNKNSYYHQSALVIIWRLLRKKFADS